MFIFYIQNIGKRAMELITPSTMRRSPLPILETAIRDSYCCLPNGGNDMLWRAEEYAGLRPSKALPMNPPTEATT